MKGLVAHSWEQFERKVVNESAGSNQRLSMKMAFFAGATILLEVLLNSLGPGDVPTAEEISRLRDVH